MDYFSTVIWVGFDDDTCDDDLRYLAMLPDVECVYLNYTNVTSAGLEHMKGLTRLRDVALLFTDVSEHDTRKIEQLLPQCRFWVKQPLPDVRREPDWTQLFVTGLSMETITART